MTEFRPFIEELFSGLGIRATDLPNLSDSELARTFMDKLNKFMYQRDEELGSDYISRFHKFWEEHHSEILELTIDDAQCLKVAQTLEPIYAEPGRFSQYIIKPPISRGSISNAAVANVRFFTAIQDFKINIHKGGRNPFEQYQITPQWFTASEILRHPSLINDFLEYLEATGSQGDKRYKWMLAAAEFLVNEHQGDAYRIFDTYRGDAGTIRSQLASPGYLGYSYKKADMFLRDMAEWGIWHYSENAHLVDVASDTNTMRIALRTSVLCIKFPLIASYLDVYCYQYSAVDNETAKAWRRTWELWSNIPGNHRPPTPASMDYLLYYSIGKGVCRPTPKCEACLFNDVCPDETRHLNPPKSISQKGATGWDSGATNRGGGGGIMS